MSEQAIEGATPLIALARRDLIKALPTETVGAAAHRMYTAGCSSVVIIDDDVPIGIWTEADALRVELADPEARNQPLDAVMSHPVAALPAEATVAEARARLEGGGIRHILVCGSDGSTLGILSQTDLAGTAGVEARLRLHPVHTALAPDPLRLPSDKPLSQAARRMSSRGQTAAVVDFADGEPGIVTERDVVRILANESGDPDLATVASRPLVTVAAADSLLTARERMLAHGIRRLAVTDADGQVTGLLGLADLLATSEASLVQQLEAALADTRARLHAEEEARRRREREVAEVYDEMFHRNTAPKLLIDPETGAIADANPAALAFYGYSREQIRQRRIQDINLLSEAEVRAEREKARHEERRYFEFRHCLANGEIRDVQVYSGPVEIGGQTYLHSIIHDVTEARRYREHLERYKAIFDTLPVGVYRNHPDTEGPFEEVNPAMARIFGAESVAELLQHTTAELYRDPEQRQRFSEELLTRGEVRRHELDLQTLDGRPIQCTISARVRYEEDGRPVFDGVVEDVTEYHKVEQERDRLIEILEAAPDYIGMTDADGRVLYENPILRCLRGPPIHPGAVQEAPEVHPEDAARRLTEEALPAAARDGIWQGESTILDTEGHTIPVSQMIVAHRDEQGQVQRYSTIMRDISEQRALQAELRRETAFSHAVVRNLPGVFYMIDPAGRFVHWNQHFEEVTGLEGDDLASTPPSELFSPEDQAPIQQAIEQVFREGSARVEARLLGPAGEARPYYFTGYRVELDDEESFILGVGLDISEQKHLETEQRLLATAFQTSQALMITDPAGAIERVNAAFTSITGYTTEEVHGANPRILASGQHDVAFYATLWRQLQEQGYWEGEIWNRRKNGEIYPEWQTITAVCDDQGEVARYVAVFHEITEQKRMEAELEHLATHDRLTGIYNRTKLYELLSIAREENARYGTPFSLIMFDIDHFKAVNDTYGHGAGDSVLRELTERVQGVLRQTDHLGRWGGEEFLILAGHVDREGAEHLAERVRRVVADEPFPTVGAVTISLGVSEFQVLEGLARLEERADEALYAAKEAGRNRVVVAEPEAPLESEPPSPRPKAIARRD